MPAVVAHDRAMTIDCETETPGGLVQQVTIRAHVVRSDVSVASGGTDAAPDPHDYFDASLAACKALTVTLAARARAIPLDRVEVHIDRDKTDERTGTYRLAVRLAFHGTELTEGHRRVLEAAAAHCPIHKLMTTSDVVITTTYE
jgi:putative redox protein